MVEVEKRVPSKTKDGVLASSAYRAVPRQDRTGAKRTGNGKRRGTLPRTGSWRGGEVPLAGLGWALAGVGTRVEPREQRVRACVRDAT